MVEDDGFLQKVVTSLMGAVVVFMGWFGNRHIKRIDVLEVMTVTKTDHEKTVEELKSKVDKDEFRQTVDRIEVTMRETNKEVITRLDSLSNQHLELMKTMIETKSNDR